MWTIGWVGTSSPVVYFASFVPFYGLLMLCNAHVIL